MKTAFKPQKYSFTCELCGEKEEVILLHSQIMRVGANKKRFCSRCMCKRRAEMTRKSQARKVKA
jgi:hypothetical protein